MLTLITEKNLRCLLPKDDNDDDDRRPKAEIKIKLNNLELH